MKGGMLCKMCGAARRHAHIEACPVDEGRAAREQLQVAGLGGSLCHRIDGEGSAEVAERHNNKQSRQHLHTWCKSESTLRQLYTSNLHLPALVFQSGRLPWLK